MARGWDGATLLPIYANTHARIGVIYFLIFLSWYGKGGWYIGDENMVVWWGKMVVEWVVSEGGSFFGKRDI